MKGHGQRFLECYNALAVAALEAIKPLYPVKPKFHQLAHCLRDLGQDSLNPKLYWGFADESLIGSVRRTAMHVYRGKHACFGRGLLLRHLLLLEMDW